MPLGHSRPTLGGRRACRARTMTPHPDRTRVRPGPGLVRRIRDVHPVWALNAVIVAVSALLVLGPVGEYAPIADADVPWWALIAIVAVTERWPVNLEFRRSAHSFSLTDVPLTLALLFTSGLVGVGVVAAGSAVALWFRKLPA